jgi:hypothetical protein
MRIVGPGSRLALFTMSQHAGKIVPRSSDALGRLRRRFSQSHHRRSGGYRPRPVSRFFYLDWAFALRIVKFEIIKWLSPLLFATGITARYFPIMRFNLPQVFLLWAASASFLIGYLILRFRAPRFLQEYKHFKEYQDFSHSHRWIVWQIHIQSTALQSAADLLRETIDKGLSLDTSSISKGAVYRVCPLVPQAIDSKPKMYEPINLNNDIYLVFDLDSKRYVLPVQESDPALDSRQKELFWTLYTACTTARPLARVMFWAFILAAIVFLISAGAFVISHFVAVSRLPDLYNI